jgi:hypothetical protein
LGLAARRPDAGASLEGADYVASERSVGCGDIRISRDSVENERECAAPLFGRLDAFVAWGFEQGGPNRGALGRMITEAAEASLCSELFENVDGDRIDAMHPLTEPTGVDDGLLEGISEILRSLHGCEQVDRGGLVLDRCPARGDHQAELLHGAAVVEAVAAERRFDRQPALVRDRGARDQGTCDEIADRAARVAVGVRTQVGGDRQLELPTADEHVERRVVSLASRLLVPSE